MKYYKVEIHDEIEYCFVEDDNIMKQHLISYVNSDKPQLEVISLDSIEDYEHEECSETEYWIGIEQSTKRVFDDILLDLEHELLKTKEKRAESFVLLKSKYYDKDKNCGNCLGWCEDGLCRVRDVYMGSMIENCSDFIKRSDWRE